MTDFKGLSKQELIKKVQELETLLEAMQETKNEQELLHFAWVGNLGTWYWYLENNRVICNDQKILTLGFQKEEIPDLIGFDFFTERLHPDDFERVMDNMRQHLYGNTAVYEVSYRIRTKDNRWLWYFDRGKITKRSQTGRPLLVSGIVFDITEQKRMEELLERQNQRLLEMSNTDFLTNLYNRRALYEKLDYEISRSVRYTHPLCVLMLDVDHFKQINDTHGHILGDQVLAKVGEVIKKSVRMTDIVGRYGGEEFLVILPECTLENGRMIAEKVRQHVEEVELPASVKATVSGGLVQHSVEVLDELVDAADARLYQAKRSGRNCIVAAD